MTEDENKKLEELHDFFMKPSRPGKPSRADQIDELLNASRTAKMVSRAFLWLCGAIVAVTAAISAIKSGGIFK